MEPGISHASQVQSGDSISPGPPGNIYPLVIDASGTGLSGKYLSIGDVGAYPLVM